MSGTQLSFYYSKIIQLSGLQLSRPTHHIVSIQLSDGTRWRCYYSESILTPLV